MKPIAGWLGMAAMSVVISSCAAQAKDKVSADQHIEALIAEMTLEEKVGQLTQYSDVGDTTGPLPDDETQRQKMDMVRSGTVGSMLNVIGLDDIRTIQEYAVEESRLGIPVMFGFDVVHGYRTSFPLPLAEAASWDLAMMEETARIAARLSCTFHRKPEDDTKFTGLARSASVQARKAMVLTSSMPYIHAQSNEFGVLSQWLKRS